MPDGLWKGPPRGRRALGHLGPGRVTSAARWAVAPDRDFTETALPSVGDARASASDPTERAVRLIGSVETSSSTVQDALGAASSRGAATPVSLVGAIGASAMARSTIQAVEDDVDAATLVDAQNAPTRVWESRKGREIPTAPTSTFLFPTRRRTKNRITQFGRPPYWLNTAHITLRSRTLEVS